MPIRFAFRTGANDRDLASASWAEITAGELFRVPTGSRLLQYRARLISPRGGNSPLLRQVALEVLADSTTASNTWAVTGLLM